MTKKLIPLKYLLGYIIMFAVVFLMHINHIPIYRVSEWSAVTWSLVLYLMIFSVIYMSGIIFLKISKRFAKKTARTTKSIVKTRLLFFIAYLGVFFLFELFTRVFFDSVKTIFQNDFNFYLMFWGLFLFLFIFGGLVAVLGDYPRDEKT